MNGGNDTDPEFHKKALHEDEGYIEVTKKQG
jgi:hypothetical protein